MLEGIRYVRRRPDLLMVMVVVFFVGTFGLNFQMTSALMATEVFHKGAGAYGILGSIVAIGSVSGALLVGTARPAAAAADHRCRPSPSASSRSRPA